ncbi:glycosyltransferase 87 family protein [Rhodococcus olei]|uniref:Glycosyltransferase 87 family protein n=1 Tax=Rhodococcus olei TaxID=2161675 RepID=A0ABP8PCZ3_9NOCA
MRTPARASTVTTVVVTLVCGLTLALAYLNKARCAGAPFDGLGRSLVFDRIKDSSVCYSDIQFLWIGREIDNHVFPYLTGGITDAGTLVGGTVEYPVLSGLLMWLGGIGSHTDAAFLMHSALILTPFALATAWMLGRLAGWPALLWSAGPPLVLYAFHNWELPVVAAATAAIFVVARFDRVPLRARGIAAAVLLAVGVCLKVYPGAFVLPLAAYVFTGGLGGRELPPTVSGRYDPKGAVAVAAAAVATTVAINLPFAVLGWRGWLASFEFQSDREADITTNSVWFWGVRPWFTSVDGPHSDYARFVSVASPLLIVAAFTLALWWGWRRYRREGTYPWLPVCAAMLCGFLLLHKVHSPQYTLWLIPFFVLLRVPWTLIGGYLLADLSMGVGVFRYFAALGAGSDASTEKLFVEFGVWGRAALLVVFFVLFLRSDRRGASPIATTETPPVAITEASSR